MFALLLLAQGGWPTPWLSALLGQALLWRCVPVTGGGGSILCSIYLLFFILAGATNLGVRYNIYWCLLILFWCLFLHVLFYWAVVSSAPGVAVPPITII